MSQNVILNIDCGAVRPAFKGAWDANATYGNMDLVRYNNVIYQCVADTLPAGTTPVNAEEELNTGWIYYLISVPGATGPKGDKGAKGNPGANGADGQNATIAIGTVTKGDVASVTNVGTETNAVLDIVLPKGDTGSPGSPYVPVVSSSGVLSWAASGEPSQPVNIVDLVVAQLPDVDMRGY